MKYMAETETPVVRGGEVRHPHWRAVGRKVAGAVRFVTPPIGRDVPYPPPQADWDRMEAHDRNAVDLGEVRGGPGPKQTRAEKNRARDAVNQHHAQYPDDPRHRLLIGKGAHAGRVANRQEWENAWSAYGTGYHTNTFYEQPRPSGPLPGRELRPTLEEPTTDHASGLLARRRAARAGETLEDRGIDPDHPDGRRDEYPEVDDLDEFGGHDEHGGPGTHDPAHPTDPTDHDDGHDEPGRVARAADFAGRNAVRAGRRLFPDLRIRDQSGPIQSMDERRHWIPEAGIVDAIHHEVPEASIIGTVGDGHYREGDVAPENVQLESTVRWHDGRRRTDVFIGLFGKDTGVPPFNESVFRGLRQRGLGTHISQRLQWAIGRNPYYEGSEAGAVLVRSDRTGDTVYAATRGDDMHIVLDRGRDHAAVLLGRDRKEIRLDPRTDRYLVMFNRRVGELLGTELLQKLRDAADRGDTPEEISYEITEAAVNAALSDPPEDPGELAILISDIKRPAAPPIDDSWAEGYGIRVEGDGDPRANTGPMPVVLDPLRTPPDGFPALPEDPDAAGGSSPGAAGTGRAPDAARPLPRSIPRWTSTDGDGGGDSSGGGVPAVVRRGDPGLPLPGAPLLGEPTGPLPLLPASGSSPGAAGRGGDPAVPGARGPAEFSPRVAPGTARPGEASGRPVWQAVAGAWSRLGEVLPGGQANRGPDVTQGGRGQGPDSGQREQVGQAEAGWYPIPPDRSRPGELGQGRSSITHQAPPDSYIGSVGEANFRPTPVAANEVRVEAIARFSGGDALLGIFEGEGRLPVLAPDSTLDADFESFSEPYSGTDIGVVFVDGDEGVVHAVKHTDYDNHMLIVNGATVSSLEDGEVELDHDGVVITGTEFIPNSLIINTNGLFKQLVPSVDEIGNIIARRRRRAHIEGREASPEEISRALIDAALNTRQVNIAELTVQVSDTKDPRLSGGGARRQGRQTGQSGWQGRQGPAEYPPPWGYYSDPDQRRVAQAAPAVAREPGRGDRRSEDAQAIIPQRNRPLEQAIQRAMSSPSSGAANSWAEVYVGDEVPQGSTDESIRIHMFDGSPVNPIGVARPPGQDGMQQTWMVLQDQTDIGSPRFGIVSGQQGGNNVEQLAEQVFLSLVKQRAFTNRSHPINFPDGTSGAFAAIEKGKIITACGGNMAAYMIRNDGLTRLGSNNSTHVAEIPEQDSSLVLLPDMVKALIPDNEFIDIVTTMDDPDAAARALTRIAKERAGMSTLFTTSAMTVMVADIAGRDGGAGGRATPGNRRVPNAERGTAWASAQSALDRVRGAGRRGRSRGEVVNSAEWQFGDDGERDEFLGDEYLTGAEGMSEEQRTEAEKAGQEYGAFLAFVQKYMGDENDLLTVDDIMGAMEEIHASSTEETPQPTWKDLAAAILRGNPSYEIHPDAIRENFIHIAEKGLNFSPEDARNFYTRPIEETRGEIIEKVMDVIRRLSHENPGDEAERVSPDAPHEGDLVAEEIAQAMPHLIAGVSDETEANQEWVRRRGMVQKLFGRPLTPAEQNLVDSNASWHELLKQAHATSGGSADNKALLDDFLAKVRAAGITWEMLPGNEVADIFDKERISKSIGKLVSQKQQQAESDEQSRTVQGGFANRKEELETRLRIGDIDQVEYNRKIAELELQDQQK